MIEGLLSLLGAASDGLGLFSGITSLVRGNRTREHLSRIQASLAGMSLKVEQLADRILYITNMPGVRDITKSRQQYVNDLKKARQFLRPVQQSLGDDLLASSIIATPQKLARAIENDPFDLLLDTRPIHHAAIHPNMIPLMFHDSGQAYLGWQSRNGLENMFDTQCDNLWLPSIGSSLVKSQPSTNLEPTRTRKQTDALASGRINADRLSILKRRAELQRICNMAVRMREDLHTPKELTAEFPKKYAPFRPENIELWQEAAELGITNGMYLFGVNLENVGETTEARLWLQKACSQGHLIAKRDLGDILLDGDAPNLGLSLLKEAAMAGDARACLSLALRYEDGDGVPRCKKRARDYMKKAADLGDYDAQLLL